MKQTGMGVALREQAQPKKRRGLVGGSKTEKSPAKGALLIGWNKESWMKGELKRRVQCVKSQKPSALGGGRANWRSGKQRWTFERGGGEKKGFVGSNKDGGALQKVTKLWG